MSFRNDGFSEGADGPCSPGRRRLLLDFLVLIWTALARLRLRIRLPILSCVSFVRIHLSAVEEHPAMTRSLSILFQKRYRLLEQTRGRIVSRHGPFQYVESVVVHVNRCESPGLIL